jgi:hypothetical protein
MPTYRLLQNAGASSARWPRLEPDGANLLLEESEAKPVVAVFFQGIPFTAWENDSRGYACLASYDV